MRRPLAMLLGLLYLTGAASAQVTQPAVKLSVPDNVEFHRDVVYGKCGETELKLNIARPKKVVGKAPTLVVIHGGSWARGTKDKHDELIVDAASRGYVAATVDYRLAPKDQFPAQIHDVKAAVRFLRANAEKYHVDPTRIGAVGFSAGAHLAMLLGTTDKEDGLEGNCGWPDQSSKVQACVSYFGPTDLTAPELWPEISPILRDFLGGSIKQKPELYRQASPINFVRASTCPMLLFQGTIDVLVNYKQAIAMAEKLTMAGVDARLELLVGLGHGWGNPERKRTEEATYAFFAQKLK